MKRKEFDLFNILLGLIIGVILGYFIFTQIDPLSNENPVINSQQEVYGNVYTIQIGSSSNYDSLSPIKERLDVLGIYYEVYEEGGKYYIFNSVYDTLEKAQNKKQIIESYGFDVLIRSDYILDLSKNIVASNDYYMFYNEIITNLLSSLKNEIIIISEIYYTNPVDIVILENNSISTGFV